MSLKTQFLDERFITTVIKHPPLPFFHCCEAFHLQDIMDSGKLSPLPCKVYGEDLLYLFYGKPAYKSSELSNSRLTFMMPICFIINNNAVSTIKRAVAFDSGAFDLYSPFLHKNMTREQFLVSPTKDALNKMVHYFFNGNDPYFTGDAQKNLDYDHIHFQVEGYHSIITGVHKTIEDDRKGSLEVQLDYPIALNEANIEAIILPEVLALSPTIKHIITNTLHIPMIPVKNYGVVSKDYYVHILEETKKLLIKKKLLNGS
ncbi:MAG: hypothetical protein ABI480_01760 [Chitinophagaceae bacterium]